AKHGPPSMPVAKKKIGYPAVQIVRYLSQVHKITRPGRAFYFKILAIILVEFLQAFNEQEIYRHPYRAAPIAVAAKQAAVTFGRRIFYAKFHALNRNLVRII